jgi:hypothetical protein
MALLVTASCANTENVASYPCPFVGAVRELSYTTKFQGESQDLSDTLYEAKIDEVRPAVNCVYEDDDGKQAIVVGVARTRIVEPGKQHEGAKTHVLIRVLLDRLEERRHRDGDTGQATAFIAIRIPMRTMIPAAARTSAGPALLVASAAIAIARSAACTAASGGTTSSAKRSWKALVTPIMWASTVRNQPTRTRRPFTATRRGARSQAPSLSATLVIVPSVDSRAAISIGSSASGSHERGHHPPSRIPTPTSVGLRRSRSPDEAVGPVGGAAVAAWLLAGVM